MTFHSASRPLATSDTLSLPGRYPATSRQPRSSAASVTATASPTKVRKTRPLSSRSLLSCLSRSCKIRYTATSTTNTTYQAGVKKSLFSASPASTRPVRCNSKNILTINTESGKSIRISNARSSRPLFRRESNSNSRLNPQAASIAVVLLEVIADAKNTKLPIIPSTLTCRFPIKAAAREIPAVTLI